MSADRLDDDDNPEVLDAPARTRHDHAPIERPLRPAATIEESPARDSPDSQPDGGWRWKGLELSPHANRVAEAGLSLRREAEGRDADGNYTDRGITPAMRRIEAELEHGSLVQDTEKFALKSPDRFKEKLAKMIERFPDERPDQLVDVIHDGIRFTFVTESACYVDDMGKINSKLEECGYELQISRATWGSSEYKGVNSRWRDAQTGVLFEVQFHTHESWYAKQATHDLYEKIQDVRTDPQERGRLADEQRRVMQAVPVPEGALDIESYRRKP
jgi:hypothetical protein